MSELTDLSASNLVKGIVNKKFSAVEVMQAHLKRINQVNPIVNAVVQQLDEQSALNAAAEADKQLAQGNALGPLHGLPITIKDHIKVKDFIVTSGCTALKRHRCHEDAFIVQKLKQAGAIIIGITNMPEMGVAFETDNNVYGRTNNPYDVTKTPGGSSGGEGAVIASGGSPLGIGSDAGGSIRLPAHFCGISGLKPTQHALSCIGNVPGDGGILGSFATFGPLARYVSDLKLSLPILSAYDSSDPYMAPSPLFSSDKAVGSIRIGYMIDNFTSTPTPETAQVMQDAMTVLRDNGSAVTEVDFLDIDYMGKFLRDTFFYGGDRGNSFIQMMKHLNHGKEISPASTFQTFLDAAAQSDIFDVTEIRRRFFEADQIRFKALNHMQNYDVIILPVCATAAKTHGTIHPESNDFYTMAFNLLGWPVCVVRCGTSKEGLPIGLQIAAKPWHDFSTLAVAELLEQAFGGWTMPPLDLN